MTEALIEATRVVLAPVDAGQLHEFGWRVYHSIIRAGSWKDEKGELQGVRLRGGDEVPIQYFNSNSGCSAVVTYSVKAVQPPGSCIGEHTEVEILAERQDGQHQNPFSADPHIIADQTALRADFRSWMQAQLVFWQEELGLAREAGLPVDFFKVQIGSLEKSLARFF